MTQQTTEQQQYAQGYRDGVRDANVGLFSALIGRCEQCDEAGNLSRTEIWLCDSCTAAKTRERR